jgi:AraC family transcriptional activator of pobA
MKSTVIHFDILNHKDLVTGKVNKAQWESVIQDNRSQYYIILFSGQFGAIHFLNGKQINIPPYSALFISPFRESRFSSIPFDETEVLIFSSLFYNRTAKDVHFLLNSPLFSILNQIPILTPPQERLHYYQTLTNLLYEAKKISKKEAIGNDLAHNIIEQILIMGTVNSKKSAARDFRIDKDQATTLEFLQELNEVYSEQNSVKYYADKLGISERQLSYSTKKTLGQTAKDVISNKLMEIARWKLTYQTDSIREISQHLGFSEEHNFSAFFKKHQEISPLQFRKKQQSIQSSQGAQ